MGIVQKIIKDVKKNEDKAVRKYTAIFDKVRLKNFRVGRQEIKKAYRRVDKNSIEAIKKAAQNIRRFAQKQFENFKDFEYTKDAGLLILVFRGSREY